MFVCQPKLTPRIICLLFFVARFSYLETHFSFLPAQPVGKITFHVPARLIRKITPHVVARPVGKIIPHLLAWPIGKITSHLVIWLSSASPLIWPGPRARYRPRARPGPVQTSTSHFLSLSQAQHLVAHIV